MLDTPTYIHRVYVNVGIFQKIFIANEFYILDSWFADHTHDKIEHYYEENIPQDTKLLLANALCFNSNWDQIFPAETTQP